MTCNEISYGWRYARCEKDQDHPGVHGGVDQTGEYITWN